MHLEQFTRCSSNVKNVFINFFHDFERVGQLYAGESLFGYVDLLQEERLHHSKAFSTPELK